jgi:predicted kinase
MPSGHRPEDITSSTRSNDRYLCGQPIKRAADAQILERRVQVFVRLQTSFRALRILAFGHHSVLPSEPARQQQRSLSHDAREYL